MTIADLTENDIYQILDLADKMKKNPAKMDKTLDGKSLLMIFPQVGFRTRVAFYVALHQLGAQGIPFQFSTSESRIDQLKYLSHWIDGIILRHYDMAFLYEVARATSVPVINAMSGLVHPTEILADLQTIRSLKGRISDLKIVYVGAGTNICASWFNAAGVLKFNFYQVCPPGFEMDSEFFYFAKNKSNGNVYITHSLEEGLKNADVVITDGWPNGISEEEKQSLLEYQISTENLQIADKNALLLPTPPIHRGMEISEEVFNSSFSMEYHGKENILYVQKAILSLYI